MPRNKKNGKNKQKPQKSQNQNPRNRRGGPSDVPDAAFRRKVDTTLSSGYKYTQVAAKIGKGAVKDMSSSKLASSMMRQLLDPCSSPPFPIPIGNHGSQSILSSTTVIPISTDASGDRGIFIQPFPTALVSYSGASTFGTWTSSDDANVALLSLSKYVRVVGLCVRIQKTSGSDTKAGVAVAGCFPISPGTFTNPSSSAALNTLLAENGAEFFATSDGMEMAWCPSDQKDLVPYVYTSTIGSDTDIDGRALNQRPSLAIALSAAAGSEFVIVVHARYQYWFTPANQPYGSPAPAQDQAAVDKVFSLIPQVCWMKQGSAVERVSSYAAKIAGLVGGRTIGALANGAISRVTC
jgi:hypothetical protein